MTPEQREELKPCPFCGGPVTLERAMRIGEMGARDWWGIKCRNTMNLGGTCAIEQVPSGSPEAAIERWNRRAQVEVLTVPQGWKAMPDDPTMEMRRAGNDALGKIHADSTRTLADRAFYVYMAMYEAAPTIPAIPGTKEDAT